MAKVTTKDLTWADAVHQVLQAEDGALHYAEIAERISAQGLKQKVGANPAASVAALLSNSLADENSPYQKVSKGVYALRVRLESVRQRASRRSSRIAEAA